MNNLIFRWIIEKSLEKITDHHLGQQDRQTKKVYAVISLISVFFFTDETMQILQQIEDQLVSHTPTQPSNMQMAKRAIRELPDLQELVKLLEKIQQKLLG